MSPGKETDLATLSDVVTACSRVAEYVAGVSHSEFELNHQLISACCYQIAVIGEAVKRLSPATRGAYSEIPWKDIAGMRDRLIHGYDAIDLVQLWQTASVDVPLLREQVRLVQHSLGLGPQ
jgi:uncharacterized protein with HEPN domain